MVAIVVILFLISVECRCRCTEPSLLNTTSLLPAYLSYPQATHKLPTSKS